MKKKLEQIIESENATHKSPHPDPLHPSEHPKTHPMSQENPSARTKHENMKSKVWHPTNENHKGRKV